MAYNSLDDINKILKQYANDIQEDITTIADEVSKEGMNKLKQTKNTYQVKSGKYNRGWRVRKESGDRWVGRTIYNSTDYQLTHLLENGHATRNGGRTRAFKHIAPVDEYCEKEFTTRVEETIKKGG